MATMTFGAVVGENVKRLREARDLTQYELIHRWQTFGLNWARSKLSALESGHRPKVSSGEMFIMADALSAWPFELFAGDGDVELIPGGPIWTRELLRALYMASA